jgi:hypothetical protein
MKLKSKPWEVVKENDLPEVVDYGREPGGLSG